MNACPDCGKTIRAESTRCRAHANAFRNRQAEMREVSRQQMLRKQAEGINRNYAGMAASLRARYADPAEREKQRQRGLLGVAKLTPEAIARRGAASGASRRQLREDRLAWCPADRRAELHKLCRRNGVAEGERIMREDLAAIERRRLAAMTPHERQMERVRNGAQLVDKFVPRRADPTFTLGGVAPEAI